MPVHIEELTTDVAVFDGDLPLSERQIRMLVELVAKHLRERERDERRRREARSLQRDTVIPQSGDGG